MQNKEKLDYLNFSVTYWRQFLYYQVWKDGGTAEDLTWELYLQEYWLIEQASQGVDYFTIHCWSCVDRCIPMTAKFA